MDSNKKTDVRDQSTLGVETAVYEKPEVKRVPMQNIVASGGSIVVTDGSGTFRF